MSDTLNFKKKDDSIVPIGIEHPIVFSELSTTYFKDLSAQATTPPSLVGIGFPAHVVGKEYNKGQCVHTSTTIFVCLKETISTPPSADWQVVPFNSLATGA